MMYTVDDITELIRYHLVLAVETDDQADRNLADLAFQIAGMSTEPLWREIQCYFCDRCGCSVDTDVLAEDGSNLTADGDFLCSSCLYPEEE